MSDKKLILAIDDNEQQLDTYKILLGKEYDLRVANSVEASLGFLVKNYVDIILLDLEMPGINGFEFLDSIRRTLLNVECPIIVVTGNKEAGIGEKVIKSGAVSILIKPVKKDTLLFTIEEALAAEDSLVMGKIKS